MKRTTISSSDWKAGALLRGGDNAVSLSLSGEEFELDSDEARRLARRLENRANVVDA